MFHVRDGKSFKLFTHHFNKIFRDSKESRNVQNKKDINPISDCSLNNCAVYRYWLSLAYYLFVLFKIWES